MTNYHIHSAPAIVGGVMAAGGATALLTKDAFDTGLTLDHCLMPLLVGITILAGHLFWQALKEWRILSAVGFGALALYGSFLTITETMGRRAEVSDGKVMLAEQAAAKRVSRAALAQTLNLALPSQKLECAGAPVPAPATWPECRRKSAHVEALRAQIATLDAELAPVKVAPVDAKGERLAAIAGLLGYAPGKSLSVIRMFEPFAFPLFLELGAIVLFGFGIRHQISALTFERPLTDKEVKDLQEIYAPKTITKDDVIALKARGMKHSEIAAHFGGLNQGRISELMTGKRAEITLH